MRDLVDRWGKLLALCLAIIAVSGCYSLPAAYGPDESPDTFVTRVPPSKVVGVAFFESARLTDGYASWGERKPGITREGQRAIEERLMAGLREKGYSPILLGTFPSDGFPDIFARDVKPNHEKTAYLQGMERKREELVAQSREAGAESLLIVSFTALRGVGNVSISGGRVVKTVSSTWLLGGVGWIDTQGRWLGWFRAPKLDEEPFIRSIDFAELERNAGSSSAGKVLVTELKDEVWTAGFSEAVLKRIPPYR
ncbi:MAG: hypothetical protein NFW16_18425 [Candidatus Accumulibacter sp.]|uniref:hypothetical protein n=1 Tax=Accumulibacter sp. TaxID=2053492 RepID=UPI002583AE53|nr:hypothetical protein [Accumulibacter sp.]MCM8623648.1 hypothetical protein [Accumulibacter sp.]